VATSAGAITAQRGPTLQGALQLGLYTILSLPISYGVSQTQGGSGVGRILPTSRAIVLQ